MVGSLARRIGPSDQPPGHASASGREEELKFWPQAVFLCDPSVAPRGISGPRYYRNP
jgi:hypothetical protein